MTGPILCMTMVGAIHFSLMDFRPEGSWSSRSLFKKIYKVVNSVVGQKKIPYSRKGLSVFKGKGLLPLYYIVSRSIQCYLPNVVYCQTLWFVFVLLWLSTCFGLLNLKGTEQLSVNTSSLKFVLG